MNNTFLQARTKTGGETSVGKQNEQHESKGDKEGEGEGEGDGEGEGEGEGDGEGEGEGGYFRSLSQPLVAAVQDLEALSSSSQFAASPAVISQDGTALQQDILKVQLYMYSSCSPGVVQCTCISLPPSRSLAVSSPPPSPSSPPSPCLPAAVVQRERRRGHSHR